MAGKSASAATGSSDTDPGTADTRPDAPALSDVPAPPDGVDGEGPAQESGQKSGLRILTLVPGLRRASELAAKRRGPQTGGRPLALVPPEEAGPAEQAPPEQAPAEAKPAEGGLARLVRAGVVRAGNKHTDVVGRVLPVAEGLRTVLPDGGLRRGATVAVHTSSLVLALLGEASRAGSWCAVVGMPGLSAVAAAEMGVVLERLALVPNPGADWANTVAALLDGVDIVVAAVPGSVAPSVAGRLAAKARQRGSVLMPAGDKVASWAGADVTVAPVRQEWGGLADGRGRLRCREITVQARGRGAASVAREVTLWLPGLDGPLPPVHDAKMPKDRGETNSADLRRVVS